MKTKFYKLILTSLFLLTGSVYAIDSVVLTDRIAGNTGIGNINLLKDIAPSSLETFRQENGGKLILGIDINESANGSEKAETQAVTIESLTLTIVKDNQTFTYTNFSTDTMAELLKEGAIEKKLYYTCLGRTGSNNIAGNTVRNNFDSTIKITVPDSLAGNITSATLSIILLDTKKWKQDPEMFYDFSGGFEDLALINQADAIFLDDANNGKDKAPDVISTKPENNLNTITSWVYYPSMNDYYFVGFEDLYPNKGDYDFNDLVMAYRVAIGLNKNKEVVKLKGISYIIAKGAAYSHDFRLKIQVPNAVGTKIITMEYPYNENNQPVKASVKTESNFNSVLDFSLFTDTRSIVNTINGLTANQKTYFNTLVNGANTRVSPRVQFEANFTTRIPFSNMEIGPFDPFIIVRNNNFDIHLIGKNPIAGSISPNASFKDENNFPFAMLLPETWRFPYEKFSLLNAYSKFYSFVTSGGTQNKNWYSFPNTNFINNYTERFWEW
jgi:LruC domain-containing protein